MKNLNNLLGQEEPVKIRAETFGPDSVCVTSEAFEKAYTYARLACEIERRSVECGGYLTCPVESKDGIAQDSYLADGQRACTGLFTVDGPKVIEAGKKLRKKGEKIIGWWHSHGNGNTFFSKQDNEGQRAVLNEVSQFNYVDFRREIQNSRLETIQLEDNTWILRDRENPRIQYEFSGNGLLLPNFKLTDNVRVGFCYAIVVDTKENPKIPYAEVGTREYCSNCGIGKDSSRPADITVFDSVEFKLDIDKMREEIKQKVSFGYGYSCYAQDKIAKLWTPGMDLGRKVLGRKKRIPENGKNDIKPKINNDDQLRFFEHGGEE